MYVCVQFSVNSSNVFLLDIVYVIGYFDTDVLIESIGLQVYSSLIERIPIYIIFNLLFITLVM